MKNEDKQKDLKVKRKNQNFEKRSVRFDEPPQEQLQKLDDVLGIVKKKSKGDTNKI